MIRLLYSTYRTLTHIYMLFFALSAFKRKSALLIVEVREYYSPNTRTPNHQKHIFKKELSSLGKNILF